MPTPNHNTLAEPGAARGLSRGQLARRSGIALETIRYYERSGLLPAPRRAPGGNPCYPPEVVDGLQFIADLRRLGFSIPEIRKLQARHINSDLRDAIREALEQVDRLRRDFF